MMAHRDKLSRWEEWGIIAAGAGSSYNVLLYLLGFNLSDAAPGSGWLWWSRLLFAAAAFVGFELALTVTVMAMRQGRRSLWAWATVGATLIAAGGVALDVAEVVNAPALHAAPAVVLCMFVLHLAAPPVEHRASRLSRELETARDSLVQLSQQADHDRAALSHDRDSARDAAGQAEAEADRLRDELARVRAALSRPALTAEAETVQIGKRTYSLRDAARALGTDKTTLSRRLASIGTEEE